MDRRGVLLLRWKGMEASQSRSGLVRPARSRSRHPRHRRRRQRALRSCLANPSGNSTTNRGNSRSATLSQMSSTPGGGRTCNPADRCTFDTTQQHTFISHTLPRAPLRVPVRGFSCISLATAPLHGCLDCHLRRLVAAPARHRLRHLLNDVQPETRGFCTSYPRFEEAATV